MNDRGLNVLEQYDLKLYNTFRARGAVLCDTDQGLKLLKEFSGSKVRLELQHKIQNHMKENGEAYTDTLVLNKEGNIISLDREGTPYIVKDWYEGRECNVRNEQEIAEAVKKLARLHKSMICRIEDTQARVTGTELIEECEKHNRELKKVRNYIRDKRKKSDFEISFLQCFNAFFEQAEEVTTRLRASSYCRLRSQAIEQGYICHGEYNHHNILMIRDGIAVTNFNRWSLDIQLADLYQFMRKILEKQNWSLHTGDQMLEAYNKISAITDEGYEYLRLRLLYPEKFWKIGNHYFNANKAWIPGKNVEKLDALAAQNKMRISFIDKIIPS